jgi:hypothetical protein
VAIRWHGARRRLTQWIPCVPQSLQYLLLPPLESFKR